jgi:hypothetical protein
LEHRPPPEVRARWAKQSRSRRGYGGAHKAIREQYRKAIDANQVVLCARCRRRILPGQKFHLDHSADRRSYLGVSHARCNLVAAGKAGWAATYGKNTTSRNW